MIEPDHDKIAISRQCELLGFPGHRIIMNPKGMTAIMSAYESD